MHLRQMKGFAVSVLVGMGHDILVTWVRGSARQKQISDLRECLAFSLSCFVPKAYSY
jgi:hypothetical protein